MNITKVYYEELRSKCVNGNWTSKKVGAEVEVENSASVTICGDINSSYNLAKTFVQNKLDEEMGDNKKVEELRKTLDKIRQIAKTII